MRLVWPPPASRTRRARLVTRSAARRPRDARGTRPWPARALRVVAGPAALLVVLAAWAGAAAAGPAGGELLPSPAAVLDAAGELIGRERLLGDLVTSLGRLTAGFLIGSIAGLAVGVVAGRSPTARHVLSPLLASVRTIPSLAWLPLLVLYLGIGETPKVLVIGLGTAMTLLTWTAGERDDRAPRGSRAAVRAAADGLAPALTRAWLLLLAAELLSAPSGLGHVMLQSGIAGRTDRVLVVLIVLAGLAWAGARLMALMRHVTRRFLA